MPASPIPPVVLSLRGLSPAAVSAAIAVEEFMIPSGDPGIELYLRNKRGADRAGSGADKILLYVHGTSQAAETTFDLRLDGVSWMDYLAHHGWDVWLVDLRGYGRSSRPPEMSAPPAAHPPIVTTDVALHDFGTAVDFICRRRGAAAISIMGWSWGTVIVGAYAARNRAQVTRLVLNAPVWLRPARPGAPPLGAYQSWTVEQARANLQTGAPDAARAGLMPDTWFAAWKEAALATDPEGARQSPPVVRSPNGAPADSRAYWQAGKPYYDPGLITAPTLIVHGEWDGLLPLSMAVAVFGELARAPTRRLVEIGAGTHLLMLERNRRQLFQEVQLFLDEPLPDGAA
ncbi:MAG TPA: alpha/beta fold hydrolase [Stellaceae bacterium]|nr:alpha/beta fold hydrolase [Stellaceae bacterium]